MMTTTSYALAESSSSEGQEKSSTSPPPTPPPQSENFFMRKLMELKEEIEDFFYPEPSMALLPDQHEDDRTNRPYTLVISLEKMLVYSNWERQHGWRIGKRPGVDMFLSHLSQFFEIVLFTKEPYTSVAHIIQDLDPSQSYFSYYLFGDSCVHSEGKVIKDISRLNRDLSKVIVFDTDVDLYLPEHRSNLIILKPWQGDFNDTELASYILFLENLGISNASLDVRKVLLSYDGQHIPTVFNERLVKVKNEILKQREELKKKSMWK